MWLDYVNSVGIVGALGVAVVQTQRLVLDTRKRDEDRRVERALELYRDLVVEGDTATAFDQLSVLLRTEGAKRFHVKTWLLVDDSEFETGGLLDPTVPGLGTTFQNIYRVLWFFERVETALSFDLVADQVMFRTIGYHCWWWGQLLRNVHSPKAAAALHGLAPKAAEWAATSGVYDEWVARCANDFDGAGPIAWPTPAPPGPA